MSEAADAWANKLGACVADQWAFNFYQTWDTFDLIGRFLTFFSKEPNQELQLLLHRVIANLSDSFEIGQEPWDDGLIVDAMFEKAVRKNFGECNNLDGCVCGYQR